MKIDEMKELRGKRAEMVIRNYNQNFDNIGYLSVTSFYKSCSVLKTRAEYFIHNEMHENGGYGYCILGGNCMSFSCVYHCGDWLVYHTRKGVKFSQNYHNFIIVVSH